MKSNGGFAGIAFVVIILLIIASLTGNDDDSYRKTLESGQQKYYSGLSMTKEEYNAVKGFNDWSAKQGSKTYSQWGN